MAAGSSRAYVPDEVNMSTLVCLIDVLGHISILGGKFSNINKRPGPNNHPGGMI